MNQASPWANYPTLYCWSALAEQDGPRSLDQLADLLGWPGGLTLRLLRRLQRCGFAQQRDGLWVAGPADALETLSIYAGEHQENET